MRRFLFSGLTALALIGAVGASSANAYQIYDGGGGMPGSHRHDGYRWGDKNDWSKGRHPGGYHWNDKDWGDKDWDGKKWGDMKGPCGGYHPGNGHWDGMDGHCGRHAPIPIRPFAGGPPHGPIW